ncbi:MAG: hypothetical protein K2Q18_04390 [Bdellovibrionales bacterium]|nr:hypothetical protein [Bdellovibrionales bacterium]
MKVLLILALTIFSANTFAEGKSSATYGQSLKADCPAITQKREKEKEEAKKREAVKESQATGK